MAGPTSITTYDTSLYEIPHYQRFSLMRPYVGPNYEQRRLLLIGESFYLPNDCPLNKTVEGWYSGNQDMIAGDGGAWINCRGLIECDWTAAGHFIYRELDRVLYEVFSEGFSSVSFMNAFQRPACQEGRSFKYDCELEDVERAIDTINAVQDVLRPKTVIFVAKYPRDRLGAQISDHRIAKRYDFVCHPGTGGRYWHKEGYPHGRQKFVRLLQEC